jgi:hypothetical protein
MTIPFFRRDPQMKIAQDTHRDRCPIYVLLWFRGGGGGDGP